MHCYGLLAKHPQEWDCAAFCKFLIDFCGFRSKVFIKSFFWRRYHGEL